MFERYTKDERSLVAVNRTNEEKEFYVPVEYKNKKKIYSLNKSREGYLSSYGGVTIKR